MTPHTVFKYIQEGLAIREGYVLENPRDPRIQDAQTQGLMGIMESSAMRKLQG